MKKIFLVLFIGLLAQAEHGTQVRMQTIFTDMCAEGVTLFQLIGQKTNGAVVIHTQCGPGASGPSGKFFPNTLSGNILVRTERQVVPMQTIYTDNCQNAVSFYQLVSQKTNGKVVFNVRCGEGAVAPSGRYFPYTVTGFIRLNVNSNQRHSGRR